MLVDRIQSFAVTQGEKMALRFQGETLTFSALVCEVDRIAGLLLRQGVSSKSTVGILCENNSAILLFYYAVAKIGGTFVPINSILSASEVAHIVGHAELDVLFTEGKLTETAAIAVKGSGCDLLDVREFIAQKLDILPEFPIADPESTFMIVYTSGSTGLPKAVMYDQRSEVAGNDSLIKLWGISPSDKLLVALPLGFLYGLSTASSMGMQGGSEVVLLPRFRPKDVLESIIGQRITVFHGVPTMFSMMLEYAEQQNLQFDLSGVRLLISAGAPLAGELKARFFKRFGKKIQDYYALTEVRPVFGTYAGDASEIPEGSIGKAGPNVAVKIVDGQGNEVGPGVTGEVLVRAPATTKGYYKDSELTERSIEQGYFRTGDLAKYDANGFFFLTGRIKDIIIRGGANIAPPEVEEVILKHPGVIQAAVIGVPDSKFGELPVAYIVIGNKEVSSQDLSDHCIAALAEFKVPVEFIFLNEMPLGSTGKIDKKALSSLWRECNGG
jgi:long-chain acyl-CoA synthetase